MSCPTLLRQIQRADSYPNPVQQPRSPVSIAVTPSLDHWPPSAPAAVTHRVVDVCPLCQRPLHAFNVIAPGGCIQPRRWCGTLQDRVGGGGTEAPVSIKNS